MKKPKREIESTPAEAVKQMEIEIRGDGTFQGTGVFDKATGRVLRGVVGIKIDFDKTTYPGGVCVITLRHFSTFLNLDSPPDLEWEMLT
jgi:hypothetical protein